MKRTAAQVRGSWCGVDSQHRESVLSHRRAAAGMEARREVTLRRECRRRAGWLHAIEATARGRTVSEPRLQNSPVFAASLHRMAVFQPPTRQVMTDAIAVGAFFSIVEGEMSTAVGGRGKGKASNSSIPGRTPGLVFDLRLAWIASSSSALVVRGVREPGLTVSSWRKSFMPRADHHDRTWWTRGGHQVDQATSSVAVDAVLARLRLVASRFVHGMSWTVSSRQSRIGEYIEGGSGGRRCVAMAGSSGVCFTVVTWPNPFILPCSPET